MMPKLEQDHGRTAELEIPTGRITFEEFLELGADRIEWVDGEVIEMSPTTSDHDRLVFFLARLLADHVDNRGVGEVFCGNLVMRIDSRPSGRIPDIMFVEASRLHHVGRTYLDGPADLAVEVISQDSLERDTIDKFREYAQAGVREFWVIDSLSDRCEFHFLSDEGIYGRIEPEADGSLHSRVVDGFWLNPAWLRRMPLPSPRQIAREYENRDHGM